MTMYEDRIVNEVHAVRERLAAQLANDTKAMLQHVRQQQAQSGRQVVKREPKRPRAKPNAA